jgi:hypothetical protein
MKNYEKKEDKYIDYKRCERLKNLLSPLFILSELISEENLNDDEVKEILLKCKKASDMVKPLIRKGLNPKITLDELNELYLDKQNNE